MLQVTAILRFFLPALLATELILADNDLALVAQEENALAEATRSKNNATLLALTDKNFHASWSEGRAVSSLETDLGRQDWVDNLTRLRIASYAIQISKVRRADQLMHGSAPTAAYVTLTESWTLISPRGGRRIDRRVESLDLWLKHDGVWKLLSRLSRTGQYPSLSLR